jgi:hypothetical protein
MDFQRYVNIISLSEIYDINKVEVLLEEILIIICDSNLQIYQFGQNYF